LVDALSASRRFVNPAGLPPGLGFIRYWSLNLVTWSRLAGEVWV